MPVTPQCHRAAVNPKPDARKIVVRTALIALLALPVVASHADDASAKFDTALVRAEKTLRDFGGIDRNAITNPANWQQCLTGKPNPSAQAVTLQPCAITYTLKKGDNEFFVAYAATTVEMCQAFCSRLEGCQQ